jgi:5-methylcytosine-specific restriction endonuclease McrA
MADDQRLLTAGEAADLMRYEPTTLAVWRSEARGPVYLKVGYNVRYRLADISEWLYASERGRWLIEQDAQCHKEKRSKEKRLRGRAAVAQRERHLEKEPFCRDCSADGIERVADEIDHILPLADGGTNSPDNLRSLCRDCHRIRTRDRLN